MARTQKTSFTKPPLTSKQKEKLAERFIDASIDSESVNAELNITKVEGSKTLYLRAPASYWEDIQEIMKKTGLTMNAVCLELLRPAIKNRLKELSDV